MFTLVDTEKMAADSDEESVGNIEYTQKFRNV
jgi:hypothetical protein